MRKYIGFLMAAALLGCGAGEFDSGAIASANAIQEAGMDICNSTATANPSETAAALVNCYLGAQYNFAVAIKLKKMDVFEAYRQRLLLLASDIDQGHIPKSEFMARYTAIRDDFNNTILSAQNEDNAARARAFAAIGAMGHAMQGAADAYQAATPPPPAMQPMPMPAPPINCRTVYIGNVANTQCY